MGGKVSFRIFRRFLIWLKGCFVENRGLSLWGYVVIGMCYLWAGTVIIARFIYVMHAFIFAVYAFRVHYMCL